MEKKIDNRFFLWFFLIFFPITPQYFAIAGFSFTNILCLVFFVFTIFLTKKIPRIRFSLLSLSVTLVIVSRIVTYYIYGDYSEIVWFLLRTLLVGFSIVVCLNEKHYFLKAIDTLILVSSIVCLFGFVEEITHFNIFSLLNTTGSDLNYNDYRLGLLRIISFNAHTIVYCIYLMFIASLILYRMQFFNSKSWYALLLRMIYLMVFLNALLTLSRSTIILFIVSQILIYFGAHSLKNILKKVLIFLVAAILLYFISKVFMPELARYIEYFIFLILAVFDDSFTVRISSFFGNDNLNAVGNRLDLYTWVSRSMNDNWVIGNGLQANFSYPYLESNGLWTWTQYKNSIEVEWLNTLFRYGIFGLSSLVLFCFGCIYSGIKRGLRPVYWEKRISFNLVCSVSLFCYFISFFSVNQSSEFNIFYVMLVLMISYNHYNKYV